MTRNIVIVLPRLDTDDVELHLCADELDLCEQLEMLDPFGEAQWCPPTQRSAA